MAKTVEKLVLLILRRIGIVAWWNGIFAPDLAVDAFGSQLASALILQHATGGVEGFFLGIMEA
jgi:hypothetical protein